MDARVSLHLTDQTLSDFGSGKLDEGSVESVDRHLQECANCRRRVAELSSDSFLERRHNAQGGSSSPDDESRGVPPAVETLPPELVDHPDYEIVRELGRGRLGVDYLARNKLMGRLEVLKVVGRNLVERPGVLERFLREIRSVATLRHDNIVTAYSAMRLDKSVVLAMEYVEGLDLALMVKAKGPLPVSHACNFVHQAALGLQHAHERGMVHHAIKPANLILAREGKRDVVKVLDFGLAKFTSEGQVESSLPWQGQMLGTPDYIAPEQILDAQSADIRADIYCLGCTLYYLLAGGPPFRGASLYDMYLAHVSMNPRPLHLIRPEVPEHVSELVAKLLAKDPGQRFQTPGEVAQELERLIHGLRTGRAPGGALSPPLPRGGLAGSSGIGVYATQALTALTRFFKPAGAGASRPDPGKARLGAAVAAGDPGGEISSKLLKESEKLGPVVEQQFSSHDRPGQLSSTRDDVAHPMIKDESMPESTTAASAGDADQPLRSTELDTLLIAVVESPEAWLSSPSMHFGGRRPSDLIGTDEEYKVVDLLQAVDQGLF